MTRLAVVLKGWPRLSETFIAQELAALGARGLDFEIWSLRHPTDIRRHALHDAVTAPVRYLPEYLYQEPLRVWRGLWAARRLPGFGAAWRCFVRDLKRDRTPNRLRRFGQAAVMARELPADTRFLYAHFLHTPASVARYAALMRGIEWGFSAHAKDIWTSPDWELREKMAEAVFGATCTGYGAARLRELAPQPDRIDLIYHGLDLSRFPDPPERAPAPVFTMLSVGRLVEKKGFDRLIEALARLPGALDWHWIHIGGGALKDALRQRAAALGVDGRIDWRGASDQGAVIAAMREADLFVLPSRIARDGDRDGLPNVLMEAASQALPILSTPVAAIPEFITDDVHGRLSDDDPDALADAITALAADGAGRARMAAAARARLIADFGMEAGIDRLEARLRDGIAP